jgi:hypothetical protein
LPPLFATMVDPYFDSLKNADAVEPRFKAWYKLDPVGAHHTTLANCKEQVKFGFGYYNLFIHR